MKINPDKNLENFRKALRKLGVDPLHADAGVRAEHPFPVAICLAAMGFRVIPTHVKTKIPCIRKWQLIASTSLVDLMAWQGRFAPNWSVLTGRDNNLFIIDVDGEEGRKDFGRLEGELGTIPATVRCRSGRVGGGFHIWLRMPAGDDDIRNQQPLAGTKIDIRGWHGHGVVGGSLHKSGMRYGWEPGCAPGEVEIAVCPPKWWDFLPKKESRPTSTARPRYCGIGSRVQRRNHDPRSLLIGDGPAFGGFQDPIYKIAIRYFLAAGVEASPETIIETLRQMVIAAPKDLGRDVSRYLTGEDLPRIVERAREFVNNVKDN